MIDKDLFTQIEDALEDRKEWEARQTTYYQMRHRGLPRLSKPYPGAPNQHLPLADTMIEKLKPYYVQQLYGNETFTTFLSMQSEWTQVASAASDWYDFQLKQNSNFEEEIQIGIDKMLESAGFSVIKIFWDTNSKGLRFDACDPLHIIVPDWTQEIECADWLVHVLHYSEAKYLANPNYNHDPDFIKRIKGKGGAESSGSNQKDQAKVSREGLTYGKDDQIVVWEVFHKDGDDHNAKWVIDTCSPVLGFESENVIRPTFGLPFKHNKLPFKKIRTEIIDKGFYSPRSLTAIVAPFETYGCKLWNSKIQWMDFFNQPAYEQDPAYPLPNTQNYQRVPGGIQPPGLKAAVSPPPPISFDEEMNQNRMLAEYRVALPDFGVVQPNSRAGGMSSRRTATEVNAIVGQSGQGNDIRGRTFRKDLGGIFQMGWDVICQYCQNEADNFTTYLVKEQIRNLPPKALQGKYLIIPNGSPDSWNKPAQLAKATTILQMIAQTPMAQYFAWDEGLQWLFELEDPRLVKRLYRDPQITSDRQATKQHEEIVLMQNRFAVKTDAGDDDKVHMAALLEYFQGKMQEVQQGEPPPEPIFARLLFDHTSEHLRNVQTKKDPAAQQIQKQAGPFLQILGQLAAQAPQNVLPMQQQTQAAGGATNSASPPTGAPTTAAASLLDPQAAQDAQDNKAKIAISAGNMLTNAIKAGVPVSIADYDVLFKALGLPLMPNPSEILHPPAPAAPKAASSNE